jgi:hypothetical protein
VSKKMPKENKIDDSRRKPNNPAAIPNTPYLRSVLELYCRLPHTPTRPRRDDRFVVRRPELQRHPFQRVHAALLLATARRLFRPDDSEPLLPIRSFRFFLPILDELRFAHIDNGYINYLAQKIADVTGVQLTLDDTTKLVLSSVPNPNRMSHLH